VNVTSDAITQLSTMHSPAEIAYLRALLYYIFDTSNTLHEEVYAIKSTDAINLASARGVSITKTAGEAAIDSFIREGWLEKSRNGFITLGERGLLELKGYLTGMFNDGEEEGEEGVVGDKIRTCHACQEIITKVSILSVSC
jgi:non-structural maintenance of chromosomes element 1